MSMGFGEIFVRQSAVAARTPKSLPEGCLLGCEDLEGIQIKGGRADTHHGGRGGRTEFPPSFLSVLGGFRRSSNSSAASTGSTKPHSRNPDCRPNPTPQAAPTTSLLRRMGLRSAWCPSPADPWPK